MWGLYSSVRESCGTGLAVLTLFIFFAAFIVLLPVIILFGIVCAVPILLLITFFL